MAKREDKRRAPDKTPIETELRLAGSPTVLEAVFASKLLGQGGEQEEAVQDLESRYFDTSDRALRARGVALRVRANGSGHIQTLKAGDEAMASLSKRGEWEVAVPDAEPVPEALPKAAKAWLPAAAFEGDLQQAFRTEMRRRTRKLAFPVGADEPSDIEVVFDRGVIEIDGGDIDIAELELELKVGQTGRLYDLALELQEIGPLHLETRSKSKRAFDRLADRPPAWHRATGLEFARDDSVDEVMAAIFGNCYEQWLANQAAAIDGRDPEGVHQMRVGLRRLRSALSTFKTRIPEDQLIWLQASAKATLSALGPARDWDVFQSELLAPVIDARPDDQELIALRNRVRARARGGYRRARTYLHHPDYTRFVLRFGQWLERRGWREGADEWHRALQGASITDFAEQELARRHRQAMKKGKHFARLLPEQRHELRIALKKLRYAMEFMAPVFKKKAMKRFTRSVRALQDDLGHLNDVAVAETLLQDLMQKPGKEDIRRAAGTVIGWHAHAVAAIEPDLQRDWKAFKEAPAFWD